MRVRERERVTESVTYIQTDRQNKACMVHKKREYVCVGEKENDMCTII